MTTRWTITREWQGETVAVLGASPQMTTALAESVRGHKTIAANRAVQFAPWADMFVALDPDAAFWEPVAGFEGRRVCGVECEYDALYAGMFYESVRLAPGHVIEIRNNVLAGMRIAAALGAAKILLVGIDAENYEALHAATGFSGFVAGLAQVTAALRSGGIEVEPVVPVQTFVRGDGDVIGR